ncbi:glycosyltransferase family 4 protein [Cellulomonas telluris]|uniref:glycosyltransferase family 4 protein n=1 Tax=Cellulomonas telluris TaxID=2306636 RepID=UPI0010A8AE61|nr:glycosyltransferase family 1 protein [Cellulomonas telluris]
MTAGTAPGPALRVGVTVEQLWQPTPGGSGTYVRELVAGLRHRPDAAVVGLAARGHCGHPDLPEDLVVRTSPLPRAATYEAWRRSRSGVLAGLLTGTRRGELDVVHATTWAVPPAAVPLVVTVHDLAFLRDPSHFTPRGNAFFRAALAVAQREAAAVVVPSATTADDCLRHGLPHERVHVVPHGVRVPPVSGEDVADFRSRHGLHRPYVLWCGTLEPRKNLDRLVAAHRSVASRIGLDLVLAGPRGWGGTHEQLAAGTDGAAGPTVHLVGRLSDDDLARAYAGAALFAFPSVWEGFGLPVLEALAHGVPVVTSAGTSMAELVTADCAVLVDPLSERDLADGLVRAARDRDALAAGARARAAEFDWATSTAAHVAVYRAVAG